MTAKLLLDLLQKYGFHIGDGVGDYCSGYDEEEMLEAAKKILQQLNISTPRQTNIDFTELLKEKREEILRDARTKEES